jgi:hypothetical protein
MLLASKAGGYMDNALLSVDGGRNMVRPPSSIYLHSGVRVRGKLMNRSLGSMMVSRYLMKPTRLRADMKRLGARIVQTSNPR